MPLSERRSMTSLSFFVKSTRVHGRCKNVRKRLPGARNVRDFLEVIRVFAVKTDYRLAVRPDRYRRAGGAAIAPQLLFAVALFRFLDFDDDIGRLRAILVHYGDVDALDFAPEMNGIFDPDSLDGINIFFDERQQKTIAARLLPASIARLFCARRTRRSACRFFSVTRLSSRATSAAENRENPRPESRKTFSNFIIIVRFSVSGFYRFYLASIASAARMRAAISVGASAGKDESARSISAFL